MSRLKTSTKIDNRKRVININGVIGDEWDGYTESMFVEQMQNIDPNEEIEILLNSVGGDVQDGFGIADRIRNMPNLVNIKISGYAASIASVIALAGDNVSMSPTALFMIHNPSTIALGESEDLRKAADILDKIQQSLIDVYVSAIAMRGKLINRSEEETRQQVENWINAETWFSAQEALEAGFIDKIDENKIKENPQNKKSVEFVNKFYNRAPQRARKPNKMANKKSFLARLFNFMSNDAEVQEELKELEAKPVEENTPAAPTAEEIEAAKKVLEAAKELEAKPVEENIPAEVKEIETMEQIEARMRTKVEAEYKRKLAEAQAGAPSTSIEEKPISKQYHKMTRQEKVENAAKVLVSKNKAAWDNFAKGLSNLS